MRTLEDNNAEDWDELLCPECGHKSIEKYPGLEEEYSSHRKKMLYASRCIRESCPKGKLDPKEVSIQLKSSRIIGKLQGFSQSIIGKAVLSIIGIITLVIIASMFGLFSGTDQSTPKGELQESVDGKIIINGTHPIESMEFTVQERDSPAKAKFKFNGKTEKNKKTQKGVIENTLNLAIQGNQPATNVSVDFTRKNSTPTYNTLGKQEISLSAKKGNVTDKKEITTVQENGPYELETSFTHKNKPELIQTGYQINNGKHIPVSEGTETTVLDLETDDTVYLWMNTQNNETKNNDTKDNSSEDTKKQFDDKNPNTDIIDYSLSSKEIQPGESVTITVTATNTGDRQEGILVGLFIDKKQQLETQMTVPAGETITEKLVTIQPKTTTTVAVNNLEETTIYIKENSPNPETTTPNPEEPERKYGKGIINGTLKQTVENKENSPLYIDTTGDGTPDCTIERTPKTCNFGELKTGSQTFFIKGETENVKYEATYTKHTSPENISIDLDRDGNIDIHHQTILPKNESFEDTLELSAGKYTPLIKQDTDVPFEYIIKWNASEKDGEEDSG